MIRFFHLFDEQLIIALWLLTAVLSATTALGPRRVVPLAVTATLGCAALVALLMLAMPFGLGLEIGLGLFPLLIFPAIALGLRNIAGREPLPVFFLSDATWPGRLSAVVAAQVTMLLFAPFFPFGIALVAIVFAVWLWPQSGWGRWFGGTMVASAAIAVIGSLSHTTSVSGSLVPTLALLLPLLLLFSPRNIYPWLIALIAPLVGFLVWELGRPMSSDDDWGLLGAALVVLWMVILALALAARLGFDTFRRRQGATWPPSNWAPAWGSGAATLLALLIWSLAPWVGRLFGAIPTITLAGATMAACVYVAFKKRAVLRWSAAACALVLALGIVDALRWPDIVIFAAERRAGGRPYCVAIADGGFRYQPASNRLDLSPILMRATEQGGRARTNHAILLLEDGSTSHFSYRSRRFEPGSVDALTARSCPPRSGFASRLGI